MDTSDGYVRQLLSHPSEYAPPPLPTHVLDGSPVAVGLVLKRVDTGTNAATSDSTIDQSTLPHFVHDGLLNSDPTSQHVLDSSIHEELVHNIV